MGGAVTEVLFVRFIGMVGFCAWVDFRSNCEEFFLREVVFAYSSTTYMEEQPSNGFPLVALREGGLV